MNILGKFPRGPELGIVDIEVLPKDDTRVSGQGALFLGD
jgi:hypothetical protein